MALAACGTGTPGPAAKKQDKPLRIAYSAPFQTLDLPRYQGFPDLQVGDLIFDTLVGYDKDLNIVPRLATDWEQPDPLTWVFTLRDGVTFHDGTKVTGEDVASQLMLTTTLENLALWADPIKEVSADGLKITVGLKYQSPTFLSNLANGPFAIQSPKSRALDPAELAKKPSGTGPYQLKSWVGDIITLTKNDDYWGEAPKQETVVITTVSDATTRFNGLEAGEFDVVQNVQPYTFTTVKDKPELVGLKPPYAQTVWLLFTHSNPILADHRVREAIALTVDVEALVKVGTEGLTRPAVGFIPPELGESDAAPRKKNIARAKQLLAEAGYPNGVTIPLYNTNGRYVGDQDIAQVLQSQLAEAGITAEISVYEYAGLVEAFGKPETGLALIGWSHRATPDAMLNATLRSTAGYNWSAYSNPKFDALMDQAAAQSTAEDAEPYWAKADAELVRDVAGIPIYWSSSLYAASVNITGLTVDPLGYIKLLDVIRK